MTAVNLTQEQLQEIMQGAVIAAINAIQTNDGKSRVKHADRPEIDLGLNENQWSFFIAEWESYKRRTRIQNAQLTDELRACCTKELRETISDFVGKTTLESLSEVDLLAKI